jgi:hypothetical protein
MGVSCVRMHATGSHGKLHNLWKGLSTVVVQGGVVALLVGQDLMYVLFFLPMYVSYLPMLPGTSEGDGMVLPCCSGGRGAQHVVPGALSTSCGPRQEAPLCMQKPHEVWYGVRSIYKLVYGSTDHAYTRCCVDPWTDWRIVLARQETN